VFGGNQWNASRPKDEPADDVLQGIGLNDARRLAEAGDVRGPGEQDSARTERSLVQRLIDVRIAKEWIRRHLCIELAVVSAARTESQREVANGGHQPGFHPLAENHK
jgi:hypothetical protein